MKTAIVAQKAGGLVSNGAFWTIFDEWIVKSVGGKPLTRTAYKTALKAFAAYLQSHLNGVDFRQVTEPQIEAYVEFLDGKSYATKSLYLIALKNFYRFLTERGILAVNPTAFVKVKSPKIRTFKKGFLMPEKARELLKASDGDGIESKRNAAILALVLTAGLRACEVVRANLNDFDFDANGGRILFVFGKGREGKDEYVKVAPQVEAKIKDYLTARQAENGGLLAVDAPLFVAHSTYKGKRLSERTLSKIAKNAFAKIGIVSPRFTLHSLRHTCATTNLLNGGSQFETQAVLRHKSAATTAIYTHELERLKNDSELRVANALFAC